VYPADEKVPFPIRPDGTAGELSFGFDPPGQLNLLLDRLADIGDLNPNRKAANPARQEALARIKQRQADPATLRDPAKLAGLAADLIRTRQTDAAVKLLAPHRRGGDFRVLATLAHAHAKRGEWADAVRLFESARLDADFPRDLPGATPDQVKWLKKVEYEYYRRWLQLHKQEAERRGPPAEEDVFPLFPVRFVNDKGEYEPGKLAEAEKAKLPPDAVAVVQQLLLWDRDDTRLFWLLGELYAATGRLREAEVIFDQCASEARQYSNRKVLMDHRAAVKRAVAALPKPAAPAEEVLLGGPEPAKPKGLLDGLGVSEEKLYLIGAVFAAVTLVMLAFQFRSICRRLAAGCGPRG
jgi:thioredoxin-like negative regulator of GroEL